MYQVKEITKKLPLLQREKRHKKNIFLIARCMLTFFVKKSRAIEFKKKKHLLAVRNLS